MKINRIFQLAGTRLLLVTLFIVLVSESYGQESKRVLTLDDVVSIASRQSPDALNAMNRFRRSYWQYRNYKAGLMPILTFDATIPSLSRSIEKVTTPEGDFFYDRNLANYSTGLALTKNLGLTGGQIFLNSNLQRIDIFGDSTRTSYMSSPLTIGINQPVFGYNKFRWLKKTEPLRYNEAERGYLEEVEQVTLNATSAFFRLLDAQIRFKIQQINLANNDTLYQIAKGRYNIGTIAENELLQIELSLLNSRSALESANLEVEMRTFELRSYLRIPENTSIELVSPGPPPVINVEAQIALAQARTNRAVVLAYERRLLEAESSVYEAKATNRFNANIYAVYGLTQSTSDFENIYKDPQKQQRLELGISIPILDWGLGKGQVKLAESNLELERTDVQQDMKDFDQEIFLKVMQYNMQPGQFAIASKSDTVALKRYEVTKQRYMIGKIGIIDLNIAQAEKDAAQQGYIAALSNYWRSYYELRKLTLFDFINKKPITFDFNDIPDVK